MSDWMFAMSRYENDVREAERNIARRRSLRERRSTAGAGAEAGAAVPAAAPCAPTTGAPRPAGA